MPQKIRFLSLTGLLLALATGFVAARPGGADEGPVSPCKTPQATGIRKTEPGCAATCLEACAKTALRLRFHAATQAEKAKDKCCCPPSKPCDGCPCTEKPKAENNTAAQGCVPPPKVSTFGIWSSGGATVEFPAPQPSPMFCPWTAANGPASMQCMPCPSPYAYNQCGPLNGPGMMPCMPYPAPPGSRDSYMPPVPNPGWMGCMPYPAPPPMFVSEPERESKEYVVEMKLVELPRGGKEKVVATPKLTVLEGESGEVSSGTSHAGLWAAGVPANDFGHEGYQIGVSVQSDRPDRVRLTCSIWTSALDAADNTGKLRESRSGTTRLVELGKATKFSCDRVWEGQIVRCWLEATVKEQKESLSAEATPGCAESCEKAAECCPLVMSATCTSVSVEAVEKMTFSTVDSRACSQTMCGADGKEGDLNPPCKLLRVCCKGTSLTCDTFEVERKGYEAIHLSVDGDRVMVTGENLKAMADSISTGEEGVLVLEGNVRVISHQEKIDVESGKVRIKLKMDIHQSGVISNPALIQQ